MSEKSKILILGGTGYRGKYIVEASTMSGHPTFALVREATASEPTKAKLIESFKELGVTLLFGDLYDHESLLKAVKQIDVVISYIGSNQLADQVKIIAAIKEDGNIKRLLTSEYGIDPDRNHSLPATQFAFGVKDGVRRAIEAK